MPKQEVAVGITISDLKYMRELFNTNGWAKQDHAFHYNRDLDRWEIFEVTNFGTLRAVCDNSEGWTEV